MSAVRGITSVVGIIVLGALLLVALLMRSAPPISPSIGSTPSGAPEDPRFTPIPEASTDPSTADCAAKSYVVKQVYADRSDPTIANRTEASKDVVIGTATVGEAKWNTESGAKPATERDGTLPAGAIIYRPITISVSTSLKGDAATTIEARWLGGAVGCEIAAIDNGSDTDVAPDTTYTFFLGASLNADGKRTLEELTVLEAWPVDAQGSIKTPLEGTLDAATLNQKVEAAPDSPKGLYP